LIWIALRFSESIKPGTIFGGWLVAAGLARTFIEFFRPDQPRIGDTFVTTSMLVSFLMAVAGVVFLLIRYGKWQLAFAAGWEEEYKIKPVVESSADRRKRRLEELREKENDESE
jgi:prolipoprotein diacylglyceryltransferase